MTNPPTHASPPRPRRAQVLGEHVARPPPGGPCRCDLCRAWPPEPEPARPPWHVIAGNLLELALCYLAPWWFVLVLARLVAADLVALGVR